MQRLHSSTREGDVENEATTQDLRQRRNFILGTAAGLILPSYYDKVFTFFENHGEPLIEIPKAFDKNMVETTWDQRGSPMAKAYFLLENFNLASEAAQRSEHWHSCLDGRGIVMSIQTDF